MLVFKPKKELLKYKGYSVYIKSEDATEDEGKFDRITTELRVLLESIFRELV